MFKRTCGIAAITAFLSGAATASAQPGDDHAQADAAFKEAMQLRSDGRDADACPKFAESQRLAPGIGVTMYLAECYERTGRTASAWHEFRAAEKLARERDDKRADIAAEHARSLAGRLSRLTVAVPPALAAAPGASVSVDGTPVLADSWNAPLAVDPGDHVVSFTATGRAPQTLHAHVSAGDAPFVARLEDSPGALAAPLPATATATADAGAAPTNADAGLRLGAVGLVVAGALGIGVGTFFVTSKTRQMDNGELCEPHLRDGAIPAATVAFAAGGVALVSGITLYYLHRPGRSEVSLVPAVTPGGAGAAFRTTF